ncbi:MAG TPA: hypothetical protein VGV37_06405 [Aliidongia sp.]|uniref:hypothetical protein n=1 Tax=Aliidongia sp. TaxID=1914230 RepID=UPI002DDCDE68|nr:hypothetical protein [Aliidongia sp.]HEV2674157.1 hypothetical protein [Aliidongia sp.]
MAFSVNSPSDIINNALVKIGHQQQLGSLWDGSDEAQKALAIYGQTRDQLLRTGDWDFARRDISVTATKTAPQIPGGYGYIPPTLWDPTVNPPLPFLFQYAYPDNCLKVRSIRPTPLFVPNFDPWPRVFSTTNDNSAASAGAKTIVCNIGPTMIVTFTGRITDPTVMEASFIETLTDECGRRLALALGGAADAVKVEGSAEQVSGAMADMTQG